MLAVGGDLEPARLIEAYARGIFPWYEAPPILWFSPDPRAVLPLRELHVPRRLARTLRQGRFTMRLDTAFPAVVDACASAPREGQAGTWITDEMRSAYCALHELGFAHSCEAWRDGVLVGGIYGVSLGAAFFGESMFHRERDASKAALVTLVGQLRVWDFELFDCQMQSAHLAGFGAREVPRSHFLAALARARRAPTRRGPWVLERGAARAEALGDPEPARID